MLMLGVVPTVVVGGGLSPDQYEGLGSFWRINDWKKALHKVTHFINKALPKPLRKVVEKVNAKVDHIDAKVSERFINLKHWSQKHRAISAIIIASILTMGAASFMAGGFAANMGAWATAAGHAVAGGAGSVYSALAGHTAATVFAAVAPTLVQTLMAKKAAGDELSAQDMQTLQQAQAAASMDPGMLAALQSQTAGGFGGGGGGGSFGPMPTEDSMPPDSAIPIPTSSHSMTVPLLVGGGILLFLLMR